MKYKKSARYTVINSIASRFFVKLFCFLHGIFEDDILQNEWTAASSAASDTTAAILHRSFFEADKRIATGCIERYNMR